MTRSTSTADYAPVRLRETIRLRGRVMCHYGPHGTLRALPLADALRLVEQRRAKLPAGQNLCWLRKALEDAATPEAVA